VVQHRLLQLREPVRVELLLRRGEQRLLLGQRTPQLAVPHQCHGEDCLVVIGELVLAQHADPEPLRDGDSPVGRLEVAAQDAKQRGLARAIGSYQPVALPGIELQGHTGEQRPVAERLGEVGDGDHGGGI
jgi:hypothetical protein